MVVNAVTMFILTSSVHPQPLVVDCGNPRIVTAVNPTSPVLQAGFPGGLDTNYPGDDSAFLISAGKAGKDYYGTPDAIALMVETSASAQPLVIRLGYRAYRYGTSSFEIRWDDRLLALLDCRGATEAGEPKVAELLLNRDRLTQGRHLLRLAETSGTNGAYVVLDAVAFEGDPGLVIVTPRGQRYVPRSLQPLTPPAADTSLPLYRVVEGASVSEVFDHTCLATLLSRWSIAGTGGGVLSFSRGAVYVPTPPAPVHDLGWPARGADGTFYLLRQAPAPPAGVIRLRLRAVYTGDEAVNLASFWAPGGHDKRYFCRFRGHLALSDGRFVHNMMPADDAFHDLKVLYGDGRAQVFCDGRLALPAETWPDFDKVCLGHAGAWQGYGIGVAVEAVHVYPRPADNPIRIMALRNGAPVGGLRLRLAVGGRETEAVTDEQGAVTLPCDDELDYPAPVAIGFEDKAGERTETCHAVPGDTWVLNLSAEAKQRATGSALPLPPQVDVTRGRSDWWLDFGAADAPVARGFAAVTPETWAQGRGCGWLQRPELTAGAFPEAGHPLAADYIECAERNLSVGFEAAVPPGDYVVSLVCGSPDFGADFRVWCEAQSAAAIRQMRPGSCDVYSFPASTQDGALTLRFDVGEALCLAGMIITPADSTAQAARRAQAFAGQLRQALAAVRAMAQGIMPDEAPPDPEPRLTGADRQRGFVAFAHPYMRTIYASSRPRPADIGAPALGFACADEYEPITFSVWPLQELESCRVAVTDLQGAGGLSVPAAAISVRAVRIWPQRFGRNTFRHVPELLEPIPPEGLELPAGQTKTFWLTVKVPTDQAPGDYRGQVTFTCNSGQVHVPVWLKVLPIKRAPLDDLVMGMYWDYQVSAKGDPDIARKQLANMREHGCNSVTLNDAVAVMRTEAGESFDFTALDNVIRLCQEAGLTAPIPYGGISSSIDRGLYTRLVTALVEEGSKRGWPELLFYPVDEPGNSPEALDLAEELCKLIKTVPGARTYVTTNGRGVDAARLDPWLDVRCYQHLSYNPDEARKTKEAGDALWFYTGPLSSLADTRLNEGLWWFRSEMTGHFYWHYCWPVGDPWYDFDGPGDYCAAYPGEEGPVDTLAWEGVREGLDDLRYFRSLQAAIAQARARGVVPDLAREAGGYLTALCERIPADGAKIAEARAAIVPEEYVAIRWRVARYTMELMAALEGRGAEEDKDFEAQLLSGLPTQAKG